MADEQVIRPSLKLVIVSYIFVFLILGAAAYIVYGYNVPFSPWHLLALLLFLVPIRKHIQARTRTLTVDADHLTIEAGILSRMRRTIDLAKVQDVTVTQSLGDRILGIGDLTVETAGQQSVEPMRRIDRPRTVADLIIQRSRELVRTRQQAPGV